MRKTAFVIACGVLALLAAPTMAQDWSRDDHRDGLRGDHHRDDNRNDDHRRDDRYDRRDGRDGRWGGEVVLFEHDGFRGDVRPLRGDVPDLSRLGFNDRVSSMRISRGVWEFCEHAYFQGKCWIYTYDAASVPKKQNDRYSSVRRVR